MALHPAAQYARPFCRQIQLMLWSSSSMSVKPSVCITLTLWSSEPRVSIVVSGYSGPDIHCSLYTGEQFGNKRTEISVNTRANIQYFDQDIP